MIETGHKAASWTPKRGNASWQKERMRPPVFVPMYRTGFFARLLGRV